MEKPVDSPQATKGAFPLAMRSGLSTAQLKWVSECPSVCINATSFALSSKITKHAQE